MGFGVDPPSLGSETMQGCLLRRSRRRRRKGVVVSRRRTQALPSLRANVIFCADMIRDVRHHLEARPFEPFFIILSSGSRYHVPSRDHANINPQDSRVVIWLDDDSSVTVAGLHIVAVEKGTARAA